MRQHSALDLTTSSGTMQPISASFVSQDTRSRIKVRGLVRVQTWNYGADMAANQWVLFSEVHDDPDEVFLLLSLILGGGCTRRGRLFAIGTPPQLELGYSGTGRPLIRSAGTVPPDWNALVAEVESSLVSRREWTSTAMVGRFRTAGGFAAPSLQLRPVVDLHALETVPLESASLNAMIVDVRYDRPAHPVSDLQRRQLGLTEAANLLAVATWPPLWVPKGRLDWTVLQSPVSSDVRNAQTEPGFWTDEPLSDGLTPPSVAGYDPIKLIDHARFVKGPVDLLSTGNQYAVDTLPALHQTLTLLPPGERRKANRALAWIADGARSPSSSVKIACAVAGIEAMLPDEQPRQCVACGQDRYQLTRRVENFLDEFAGTAMRKEYRDGIYQVRSGLVHGQRHYEVDELPFSPFGDQHLDVLKVTGAATAAVLNWLLAP